MKGKVMPATMKLEKEETRPVQVRLPVETHRKLKLYAFQQQKTLREVIMELCERLPALEVRKPSRR